MGPVRGASQLLAGQRESGAFAADETPDAFTLTPALSLRGRGRRCDSRSCIRTVRLFEMRPVWLPLPAGEAYLLKGQGHNSGGYGPMSAEQSVVVG